MKRYIKKYFEKLYNSAVLYNDKLIFSLLEKDKSIYFLDLGCDDGLLTIQKSKFIGTNQVFGVEIVNERAILAERKGINVKVFDLNGKFEYEDNTFHAIHANQVIEHIYNVDNFMSEIYRILKPNGYAIISTENASSWCNIFASILGWQIFSLTNFSQKKSGIGNPISLHRDDSFGNIKSWNHIRIYSIKGLKEYFQIMGFKVEKIKGSGYFPLPAIFGDFDKIHCHFMTFKIRK